MSDKNNKDNVINLADFAKKKQSIDKKLGSEDGFKEPIKNRIPKQGDAQSLFTGVSHTLDDIIEAVNKQSRVQVLNIKTAQSHNQVLFQLLERIEKLEEICRDKKVQNMLDDNNESD